MKKRTPKRTFRTSLLAVVALVIVACTVISYPMQASGFQASHINRLDGKLDPNYKDYLDSSVMYKLPSSVKPGQTISVIVSLDIPDLMDAYECSDQTVPFGQFATSSQEAADIAEKISERKAAILEKLDKKKVSYTLGQNYDTLLSGFEILIKARDFEATCKSLNAGDRAIVGESYKAAETQLVDNPVNVYDTGIFDSSNSPYDGSGMVVAVLDTGLDSNHSAFSVNNFTSTNLGLTYEQVAALVNKTTASKLAEGITVDDVYINNKVPFGFDYADEDPDVYSTHSDHGTHVSGIIVGKDDVITGVAPNAQLVSMKIFSDVQDTARASWILAALEDCAVLGVDVINMSLGTSCGFARETDEKALEAIYDKLRASGVSLVAAASNSYSSAFGSEANGNLGLTSNPDTGTVGSPSTFNGVLSVASISGVESPYLKFDKTFIYFNEATDGASKEKHFCDDLLGDKDSVEVEYILIPGVGRSADYSGLDVKGKVVLVRRGSNTFEEKAIIAEKQGAAGIIVYNNVSGEIRMNVGDAKLAVCSVSQSDGEMLAAKGSGKLTISKSQTSGPFISDFSSWGPTPSLQIKPEITGHGGNILSAVTGGSYDRMSGTSMACPNMAGVVALLRQYVTENFPEISGDHVKVNAMVNCLLMSTADIALNTNGLPYAVRKQGSGLANLLNATGTDAYIITYDKDGKPMDKTKLELGDDPEKTGVYELYFSVKNFGDQTLTYDLSAYVLTEGVSDTKTNAGLTTVTEEAYELAGAKIEVSAVEGGTLKGKRLSVEAGASANVRMTITLSDSDKKYLNESFKNGMYVEGFVTLRAVSGTDINMSVPYLAFYGDWTKAPMFDRDYYETNADELDDSIAVEDKNLPDAYATRPIGGVSEDYIGYMGSYYFLQNPNDMIISASRDYIALSNQDGTLHSLRFVWAGLLRNAEKIVVTITDDTTGEVIFETVDYGVRKSYGDGGTIAPANVEIEFDTKDYNLKNNTEYTVKLQGYLDYGNGGLETNEKNTFEFPLVVDFEAPTMENVEFYYEYDKTLKKNRLYAKMAIYDNHFAMAAQIGYVRSSEDENGNPSSELVTFDQYLTPIYSQRNSVTYVTYELTDSIFEIKENAMNKNTFVVTCYDYALNYATYEIGLPDNYVDFYFDGLDDGLTLSPNEIFSLEPLVYPNTEWAELLEFTSSKPGVVRVVNDKLVAVGSGSAIIKVRDPSTNKSIMFPVKVLTEGEEGYRRFDKPVADTFELTGYYTSKAYYILNSEDKMLGDTGETRFFSGNYSLTMYPSESVYLLHKLDAYFPKDTTVEYESSNESIVKVDETGHVVAVGEGFASVTVKVMQDGRATYYSESVSVEVKDPYIYAGGILNHYYGNGGLVAVPASLRLTEIGQFAFSNFNYVAKTPEELVEDDPETSKMWYIGDATITKVIIPEGVEKIGAYAFANLTALEEIVLPSTLEAIDYGAFTGCSSLQKITFSGKNNLKIINQNAFEGCDLRDTVDLSAVCVISDYAFAGNKNLEGVTTGDTLLSIGRYAFAGCKKLETVTITAPKVKYGAYAFTDCETLTSFYVNAAVLPEGMFYQCEKLKTVTIGPDVKDIGAFAFRETAVNTFEISTGSTAYKVQKGGYVLSADGATLIAVAPSYTGSFTESELAGAGVTAVGKGAFSHNMKLTSVSLPKVTTVGDYGFGSCLTLKNVELGKLTDIGEYAFFETGIKDLPTLAEDVSIGKYAFSHTKLTQVAVPDGTVIAEGVFSQCLDLQKVVIGSNVVIGDYAFQVDKDSAFKILNYIRNDTRYFYYSFATSLKELTIGDNAVIGENAFANAASLEKITLGSNAEIGYMAFYNNASLKYIDLSKAASVGGYAFSGDVYYVCMDDGMSMPAVSEEGTYIYTYHAPLLESVDLAAVEKVGKNAFSYCRELNQVTLGDGVSELGEYAFAGCAALKTINLGKVATIGDYAFSESGITSADLSGCTSVGEYAFVYCHSLTELNLNTEGTVLGEGTFAYCENLAAVGGSQAVTEVGDYAFAYTGIVEIDLSGAQSIGDMAFLKEELTPFTVTLGGGLTTLGDNPFAMCKLDTFYLLESEEFNGVVYTRKNGTYKLSDNVSVIDGSLYCGTVNGMELITYAGTDLKDAKVADGTVRITSYAFAGSDVKMVTLPYTVAAVGHKAFFDCRKLKTVVFNSYDAPILEEEFDQAYYESLQHIPGSGNYGSYVDYDGNTVQIEGTGLIPYYMWNVINGMYSNVFYGANFVDYVGSVENKLTMVRPVNGQHYDSYILRQYFDLTVNGAAAADDITLEAIAAINAIPERVTYEDRALVEAARAAYSRIATTEQQALVTNYADLISAEQRIVALTPTETEPGTGEEPNGGSGAIIGAIIAALAAIGCAAAVLLTRKRKAKPVEKEEAIPQEAEENVISGEENDVPTSEADE